MSKSGRPSLLLGIKRALFRANDARAHVADAEFSAIREQVLAAGQWRCRYCGYESSPNTAKKRGSHLQVHHMDDDHHNSDPSNLVVACALDHAYHHIGCNAPSPGAPQGWSDRMRLAFLPEISPQDCNSLQRATGVALTSDEEEKSIALEVLNLLGTLALPVRDAWGSNKAGDFAACMDGMTHAEYERAQEQLATLRVLFHPDILKIAGQQQVDDAFLLPIKSWPGLLEQVDAALSRTRQHEPEEAI